MITGRAVRRFRHDRPVDRIPAAELGAWLLELRETLAPESIAGYVRGLKAFGNWCNAEELAAAAGFRALRRPHVPHKLIAPFSTGELERLLALADPRERALTLLLLDTGLRLAAQIAHLLKHAVKGGPVGDGSAEHGRPVGLVTEGQPIEPRGPPSIESVAEPDLIRVVLSAHRAPVECPARSRARAVAVMERASTGR